MQRLLKQPKGIIIAVLAITVCTWVFILWPRDSQLSVTFLDVGQGDCAVIRTPSGKTLLIDSGGVPTDTPGWFDTGRRIVAPYLRRQGINRVDIMVATHWHEDHIGGMTSLAGSFRPSIFLVPDLDERLRNRPALFSALKNNHTRLVSASRGTRLLLDRDTVIDVLSPPANHREIDENDSSLVILLTYKRTRFLFSGDCGEAAERVICKHCRNLRADVLKVGHHGSAGSSSSQYLARIHPKIAVISVGADNRFSLPSPLAIRRLHAAGCLVFRTDRDGAVRVTSDGQRLRVRIWSRSTR